MGGSEGLKQTTNQDEHLSVLFLGSGENGGPITMVPPSDVNVGL